MPRLPNSLPESKEFYVQRVVLRRRVYRGLAEQAGSVAIVMYHSEVPLGQALRFTNRLADYRYRANYDPQELSVPDLEQLFMAAGASRGEASSYALALENKRRMRQ